ncbi:MAG: alpha/beta fold hydrolase [Alphaproteobacteria bacterium]
MSQSRDLILCLSGWAQKHDSLEAIFDYTNFFEKYTIKSLDYSALTCADAFFDELKNYHNCQIAIGWSLGGQLLLRSIAQQLIKPKYLILLAPPFQMLKDHRINSGMPQELYRKVQNALQQNSIVFLRDFLALMAKNDRNARQIIEDLAVNEENFHNLKFWYEELCNFSCFDIDFSLMPRTLYFHGHGDAVVHISQKDYFASKINDFQEITFEKCGHAPHISHLQEMRKAIEIFLQE